jgi:hypothetical protein
LSASVGLSPGDSPIPSRSDAAPPIVTVDGALASGPIPELLERVDQGWRPWAVRAIAAALAVAGEKGSAQRNDLFEWVRTHYTTEINGVKHLPREIALDDPGIQAGRLAFAQRALRVVGTAAVFVVGGLAVGGMLYLSWRLVTAVAPDWPAVLRGFVSVLLFPAGSWLVTRGMPMLLRWYWSLFSSFLRQTFTVGLSQRPDDLNRPLTVPWGYSYRSKVFFIERTSPGAATRPTTEERYRLLRGSVGLPAEPRNDRLLRLFNAVLHVKVVIEPAAAAAPWEAIFGLSSPETPNLSSSRVHVYRSLSAYRTTEQSDWNGSIAVTTWLSQGLHLSRGSTEWGSLQRAGGRIVFETASSTREYEEPRSQTGVLHIIGTPVERRGDVYLQIGGLERSREEAYLIAVEDLVLRYTALRLLLVQATPSASADRTASDRLEAAFLKRMGAAAFQAGVPAVLIVPGIPAEVTEQITAILFDVLRRNRRNASPPLIAAHRQIQERVGAAWASAPDECLAAALDTCLYVADRVNLHVSAEVGRPSTTNSTKKGAPA